MSIDVDSLATLMRDKGAQPMHGGFLSGCLTNRNIIWGSFSIPPPRLSRYALPTPPWERYATYPGSADQSTLTEQCMSMGFIREGTPCAVSVEV